MGAGSRQNHPLMLRWFRFFSRWPLWALHALGSLGGWAAWLFSGRYRRRFLDNARQAGLGWRAVMGAIGQAGHRARVGRGVPLAGGMGGAFMARTGGRRGAYISKRHPSNCGGRWTSWGSFFSSRRRITQRSRILGPCARCWRRAGSGRQLQVIQPPDRHHGGQEQRSQNRQGANGRGNHGAS